MPFKRSGLPLPQRSNNAYRLPLPNEIAYRLLLLNCLPQGNAYCLPQEFEKLIEQFIKQLLKQLGVGVETFPLAQAQGPGPGPRPGLGPTDPYPQLLK